MQKLIRMGFAGATLALVAIFSTGCGSNNNTGVSGIIAGVPLGGGSGGNGSGGSNGGIPSTNPATLKICSPLSFAGVTWPSSMSPNDQQALELALNISGSFEGDSGWANLTNNFDGQGLSMGLLNQTLGVGSLEPLLVQMMNTYPSVMAQVFDATHLQSLEGMLKAWQSEGAASDISAHDTSRVDGHSWERGLSVLSEALVSPQTVATADDDAVTWAANNLYLANGAFQTDWQNELTAVAQTPQYISIQIQAAQGLHNRALAEEKESGLDELRAYLFMFDVNVQNGGVDAADFATYKSYVAANPSITDTGKLNELLQLTLAHVLSEYVSAVQGRKQAIINGTGTVNETPRNLPSQYCYNSLFPYL